MRSRGRKSAAQLSVVRFDDGQPNRVRPPDHLGEDERNRFVDLVGSVDADHFRPSDLPLLCRFVEADLLAQRAAAELREQGPVIDGRPSPWITVQEKAVRAIVALSMRLRLAPQSRIDPKTVSRREASELSYYARKDLGYED